MRKSLLGGALVAISGLLIFGLTVGPVVLATVPGNNSRVSVTSSGAQPSQESYQSVISRDGHFVAFSNNQNAFVGTDSNNAYDVFVRDVVNNTTTRASVSTSGVSADQGGIMPAISETGRYIVFVSSSTNLIDGRTISTTYPQMYMRDTAAGITSILTEVSPGTFANSGSTPVNVSTDGRFVLFRSGSTNLGPTMTNGPHNNIFLLDRVTSAITWVNAQASGASNYSNDSYDAAMSCDGSFIVFDSSASYLGLPSSSHVDVFLLDRRGGNHLTNLTASASGTALDPKISCNGNYIGLTSYANNLDPMTAGISLGYHGYIYDRINSQFKLVDQNSSSSIANTNIIYTTADPLYLSISDRGAAVFASYATNLDAVATSGVRQLYVRDPQAGTTELLTRDSTGTAGDDESRSVTLSLDGKLAVYESFATNLIGSDSNGVRDIFTSETGL